MTPKLDDAEARREILDGDAACSRHVWELGHAIDRHGPPIEEVDARQLADILELQWPIATRSGATTYAPNFQRDAARTFLPRDLKSEDERRLASLASRARNPLVKARLYDVLAERFKAPVYARNTVTFLLECAVVHAGDEWSPLHDVTARALHVACALRDPFVAARALEAHTDGAGKILAMPLPFALSLFANDLTQKGARYLRQAKLLLDPVIEHWRDTLNLLGFHLQLRGDWSQLERVRHAQESLCKMLRDESGMATSRRLQIEEKLLEAAARKDAAPAMIQTAMELASNFGFTDLLTRCKGLLPSAIEQAAADIKPERITFEIARDEALLLQEVLHRSPDPCVAIRTLSTWPLFSTFPGAEIEELARQTFAQSPMLFFIGGVAFSGNKISQTSRGGDIASKVREFKSQQGQLYLARTEALAGVFLAELFDGHIDEDTLANSLWHAPWLGTQRRLMFTQASKHFAHQDWYAAGTLLALAYEGFLRDLLRATGYPAFKYDPQDGTTSDELLNSLAWGPGERLLGADHMALVRFLLCDPSMGWNIRNEIAHANVNAATLTPGRVFMIALLAVRLTLFDPGRDDSTE